MSQNHDLIELNNTRSDGQRENVALLNVQNNVQNDGSVVNSPDRNASTPSESNYFNNVIPLTIQKFFPPRGRPAQYITRCLACILIWAAMYCVIGQDAWLGGNIFSIYVLLVAAALGGVLVGWHTKYFHFPPLLGMLIVGFMLKNIDYMNIAKNIDHTWSSTLRNTALVVILLRSGLGLDIEALKKLKCTVLRLAFIPCIVEAVTVSVIAHYLLQMPWLWSFQLGFILGAVSPAVVVPSMLSLQNDGYGVQQGIPTLVMAASSCDDVLSISMFGVFLGIAFSEGNFYFNIFRGPLEIAMGIISGLLIGVVLWYFPWRKAGNSTASRSVLLFGFGMLFLFGANKINFAGAGALGVLCLGATATYGWGEKEKEPVENVMGILWQIFQPLLFGLIGSEVKINYLEASLVGKGIGILFCGLVLRITVTYLVVFGNNLSVKAKLFCAIAWLPKATVQAAIGSIPLDTARKFLKHGQSEERYGIEIVTIAVLVILITAPLGAIGISLTGPRWLKKQEEGANVNILEH